MQDTITPQLKPSSLWFGMVGAPVAWGIYFFLVWALVEMGCRVGMANARLLGVNAIQVVVALLGLVTAAIIILAGWTAYRTYRVVAAERAEEPVPYARAVERSRFMALVGMAFSALFLTVVVFVTAPVFALPACNFAP